MVKRNCDYCGKEYSTDINNYKYSCPDCIKEYKTSKNIRQPKVRTKSGIWRK